MPPQESTAQAQLFALGFGFGTSKLIDNSARLNYLLDATANPDGATPIVTNGAPAANPVNSIRSAAKKNDLHNWTPIRPILLCGCSGDPTVFYTVNTQVMQGFWSSPSPAAPAAGLVTVLDVDFTLVNAADPFAALKAGLSQANSGTAAAAVSAGASDSSASAVTQAHRGLLVPPLCNAVARGFFQQAIAAGL